MNSTFDNYLVVDIETDGLDPLDGRNSIVAIGMTDISKYYDGYKADVYICKGIEEETKNLRHLKRILEEKLIVGHNLLYEYTWFYVRGMDLLGEPIRLNIGFDTAIAHYLLYPGRSHALKKMSSEQFNIPTWGDVDFQNIKSEDENKLAKYNALDVLYTYEWLEKLLPLIETDQSIKKLYYEIELPMIECLFHSWLNGYYVDGNYAKGTADKMLKEMDCIKRYIMSTLQEPLKSTFNLASPDNLRELLYSPRYLELKEIAYGTGKRKKAKWDSSTDIYGRTKVPKNPKTDIDTIEKLIDMYTEDDGVLEILEKILRWKKCNRIYRYLSYEPHIRDKKVHPNFNLVSQKTGRISVTGKPTLTGIPKDEKGLPSVRRMFIGKRDKDGNPETAFVKVDFKAQELRILAGLSGDKTMLNLLLQNIDIPDYILLNTLDDRELYDYESDEYKNETHYQESRCDGDRMYNLDSIKGHSNYPSLRQRIKAFIYGIGYGGTAKGLSTKLGLSEARTKRALDNFYTLFPATEHYFNRQILLAKTNNEITDLLGRKSIFKAIPTYYYREQSKRNRQIRNFGIQSLAVFQLKYSIKNISEWIKSDNSNTCKCDRIKMLSPRHDEIQFYVPIKRLKEFEVVIRRIMEEELSAELNKYNFSNVKMVVDIEAGDSWCDDELYGIDEYLENNK